MADNGFQRSGRPAVRLFQIPVFQLSGVPAFPRSGRLDVRLSGCLAVRRSRIPAFRRLIMVVIYQEIVYDEA